MKYGTNHEGYPDPTANAAVGKVTKEEKAQAQDQEAERRIGTMMAALKAMARGFGFEVTNRVEFRDKYTGREYK